MEEKNLTDSVLESLWDRTNDTEYQKMRTNIDECRKRELAAQDITILGAALLILGLLGDLAMLIIRLVRGKPKTGPYGPLSGKP